MIVEDIGLFQLGSVRMSYLSERHRVLANNVANADTPDFKPGDLLPFDKALQSAAIRANGAGHLVQTDDQHLTGLRTRSDFRNDPRAKSWEIAPSGNAVVLEEEMIKAIEATGAYDMATQVLRKSAQMLSVAIRFRNS